MPPILALTNLIAGLLLTGMAARILLAWSRERIPINTWFRWLLVMDVLCAVLNYWTAFKALR